jgi:hypothetical protein
MEEKSGAAVLAALEGEAFATLTEAGAVLRLHRTTVAIKCKAGLIPGTKSGGDWRIPVAWLKAQAGVAAS